MLFLDRFKYKNKGRVEVGKLTLAQLSKSPVFTNDPKSSDDDKLVKQARSLIQNGNLVEATVITQDGLQTWVRKDRLCEVMGDIFLDHKKPDAIGWYMQACLIASPSWEPYLLVSYAARSLGLDEMAWRCLNACDAIRSGPRIPQLEAAIQGLVMYSDQSLLLIAMQNFETAMDLYLPLADEFPHNQMERSIFLHQNIDGDPAKPPHKQLLRLMKRE